jgi:catechol 2,3-dioxygenase-like lactoylglutathione lyase family enzyme
MITCTSVSASSEWYQRVLGFESAHGGDQYEMLISDGEMVLQLHELDAHEHPALLRTDDPLGGNGVALWFDTATFDADVDRIHSTDADVAEDVHVNPLAQHREIWLRDPDGYVIVLSSPYGDVG